MEYGPEGSWALGGREADGLQHALMTGRDRKGRKENEKNDDVLNGLDYCGAQRWML